MHSSLEKARMSRSTKISLAVICLSAGLAAGQVWTRKSPLPDPSPPWIEGLAAPRVENRVLPERERGPERREKREGDEPTHAEGMFRQRYLQRVAGHDSIPIDGLIRAKEQIDAMRSRARDSGLWTWQWLGPGNIGGRIRSLVVHPTVTSRIFIGSVSGGIWRSDNGGGSWNPVDDFMANLAVTSIVIDPNNSNVMYASTGEGFGNLDALPGGGIFRSTDGGVTWDVLSTTNNVFFRYVNRLAHHPTTSNLFYAAGWAGILWRTSNGGSTWEAPLISTSEIVDVKIQPTNANRILVGTAPDEDQSGQVYLSTDAGGSFVEQTTGASDKLPINGGRCEVAFGTGGTFYVAMDRNNGELYRTTDAGDTWDLRSTTSFFNGGSGSQGWYDNTVWVDPTNNNFLVVGGIDLWRSTNGGSSFTRISQWQSYRNGSSAHADQHTIVPHPNYNGSTNRQVYFGNDGGIQTATNVATVTQTSGWTNLANNLGITQFYGGAAAPDGSVILGGTQDNDNLRYTGGGTGSWFQAEDGDGGYCAVDFNNFSNLYGEFINLQVEKSTDGGSTYANAFTGILDAGNNNSLFIAPLIMDPNNSSVLLGAGIRIWRTTNGAASWSQIRTWLPGFFYGSALGVKPGNSAEIWAGYTDGTVSRTTNTGTNWSNIDAGSPGLPDRWVTDIAVSPYFSQEAIVTLAGYNSDNVWVTVNAGATWLRRTGTDPDTLPALQVNCASYHPTHPDWIYLGTDLGVFASHDFGLTWSVAPAYPDNEGPANVEVDEIFWYGDQMVVATHGRGMYRSRPLEVVYVDQANNGFEDGSASNPYNTVREGIQATGNDTQLSIKAGTYTEGTNLFDRKSIVTPTGGAVIVR